MTRSVAAMIVLLAALAWPSGANGQQRVQTVLKCIDPPVVRQWMRERGARLVAERVDENGVARSLWMFRYRAGDGVPDWLVIVRKPGAKACVAAAGSATSVPPVVWAELGKAA